MIVEKRQVSVIVEKRRTRNQWQPWQWRAVAVLPGAAETPAWTVLSEDEQAVRYFAGVADLVLYSGETQNYKPNVEADGPSVFVVLRPRLDAEAPELHLATVDAGEAQAHADFGDDILEALPMPAEIRDWVADFVATHHVERAFYKRKRDKADPEALAHGRPRGAPLEDEDE